jgi:hypothetical protein
VLQLGPRRNYCRQANHDNQKIVTDIKYCMRKTGKIVDSAGILCVRLLK